MNHVFSLPPHSFKAHSSGKLFPQNKPIRNFFMLSNAHYNPWNIFPMRLNAQRADERHKKRRKIKRWTQESGKGYKSYRKWQMSQLSLTKLHNLGDTMNRSQKCACAIHTYGGFTKTARSTAQPQKQRGKDTEGWKAKDLQTLSAAGAMFSAHSKAFDDSIIYIESLTTYTFIHVFLNIHLSHPLKS